MLISAVLTSKGDKRISGSEVARYEITVGDQVLMLTLSHKDLEFTLGGCSGKTQ